MVFTAFLIAALVVWRVTHLLQAEDGPWNVVARLRRVAGQSMWGRLLDCFYCLSLWVAAPAAWVSGGTWWERAWLWPALSGAAILLERVSTRVEPPTLYSQEGAVSDVLLREEPTVGPGPTSPNSSQR
jgi:hypothetical protein